MIEKEESVEMKEMYDVVSIRCGGGVNTRRQGRYISYKKFLEYLPPVKEENSDLLDLVKSFYKSDRVVSIDVFEDSKRRERDRVGSLHYLDVRKVVPDYDICKKMVKYLVNLNRIIYKVCEGDLGCNYNPGFSEFKISKDWEITSVTISTPMGYRNFVSCSTYDFEMSTSAYRHFITRGFRKLYEDIIHWLGDKATEKDREDIKEAVWEAAWLIPLFCTIFSDIEKDLPSIDGKNGIGCVDILVTGGYGTTKRVYNADLVGLSKKYSVNVPTWKQLKGITGDDIEDDYMLTYIY